MNTPLVIDQTTAMARHIAAGDFAPCAEAFIDRRNPNSEGKLNYSFIGPGVSQSDKQMVNLREAHGFNVGGVTLPTGRVNNLHLHFTAEVFICAAGKWDFLWGNRGEEQAPIGAYDVFTIPTWIFRGFINRGGDDAFLFAVLGGDDTGGIIWNPQVLADAEQAGLRLSAKQRVIDERAGDTLPAGESYIQPMAASEMEKLPIFTPAQMEHYIVRWDNLQWRNDALAGGGALAPVLGYGMTAARHHYPPVAHPHGFSLEWLKLPAGEATGVWTTDKRQVVMVFAGAPQVHLNEASQEIRVPLAPHSIYSVPPQTWRGLSNDGPAEALLLLINGGDERLLPQWDKAALQQMAANGQVLDAAHYFAPAAALGAV